MTDSDQSNREQGRRVKAARALAGLTIEQLAERLTEEGRLGARTLRKIEAGDRPVRAMELREIARACDVPYGFFTTDFDVLDTIERSWPPQELLADAGLGEDSQARIVRHALGVFVASLMKEKEVEGGPPRVFLAGEQPDQGVVIRTIGATAAEQRVIADALEPLMDRVEERLERRFARQMAALEEQQRELVSSQQSAREEVERVLEEAAQRRERQRDSTEREPADPPREAREQ